MLITKPSMVGTARNVIYVPLTNEKFLSLKGYPNGSNVFVAVEFIFLRDKIMKNLTNGIVYVKES